MSAASNGDIGEVVLIRRDGASGKGRGLAIECPRTPAGDLRNAVGIKVPGENNTMIRSTTIDKWRTLRNFARFASWMPECGCGTFDA